MADKFAPGVKVITPHAGTYGNKSTARPPAYVTGAANVADVLHIGKLPKGAVISPIDLTVLVLVAMTATVDARFGFAYVNSNDGTDDDNFFIGAGADMATIGKLVGDQFNESVELAGDAYITCTLETANNVIATAKIQALCDYLYNGLG